MAATTDLVACFFISFFLFLSWSLRVFVILFFFVFKFYQFIYNSNLEKGRRGNADARKEQGITEEKKESKQNDDLVDGKTSLSSLLYSTNSSESALFAYPPACFVPRT